LQREGEIQVLTRSRLITVKKADVRADAKLLRLLAPTTMSALSPKAKVILP
jgi:hypothetical protein